MKKEEKDQDERNLRGNKIENIIRKAKKIKRNENYKRKKKENH